MEIIRIAGYTEVEKLTIARKYLMPKQREANGLADVEVDADRHGAPHHHPRLHARGRRAQPRARDRLGVCRKVAREVVKQGKPADAPSIASTVVKYLGVPRVPTRSATRSEDQVGMVNGLAWTEFGGEVLVTEAATMPGKGKLIDHRHAARRDAGVGAGGDDATCAAARGALGIDDRVLRAERHPHPLPRAPFPKDGPSARASPWPRRWCRPSPASPCAATSR